MRILNLLFLILLLLALLAPTRAARPGKQQRLCAFPSKAKGQRVQKSMLQLLDDANTLGAVAFSITIPVPLLQRKGKSRILASLILTPKKNTPNLHIFTFLNVHIIKGSLYNTSLTCS